MGTDTSGVTCECDGDAVPGTFGVFLQDGCVFDIQRCDLCERFGGDLEAADAVANHFGGRVYYAVDPDNEDFIMAGTNPWVKIGETGPRVACTSARSET